MIGAILFDLDDTLYDREATFVRWARQFIAARLPTDDDTERAELLHWLRGYDTDGYGSKMAAFVGLAERYPHLFPDRDAAHALYDEFLGLIVLEADALRLLDRLDKAGIPFGVVTNGSRRQHEKITRLGLDRRTACLFVSDTFGEPKPAPAIFLAAADCLGVAPEVVLFVGDHPINDILGAHRAGMMTAWLHRGKPWPHGGGEGAPGFVPDFVLDGLDALEEILYVSRPRRLDG